MPKNKIEDLRNIMFTQLERLNDDEDMKNPEKLSMEIQRATAIAQTAQVIVNTAKIEVDFIKATGRSEGTGFIPELKYECKK
jgi:hypothetical protein